MVISSKFDVTYDFVIAAGSITCVYFRATAAGRSATAHAGGISGWETREEESKDESERSCDLHTGVDVRQSWSSTGLALNLKK